MLNSPANSNGKSFRTSGNDRHMRRRPRRTRGTATARRAAAGGVAAGSDRRRRPRPPWEVRRRSPVAGRRPVSGFAAATAARGVARRTRPPVAGAGRPRTAPTANPPWRTPRAAGGAAAADGAVGVATGDATAAVAAVDRT